MAGQLTWTYGDTDDFVMININGVRPSTKDCLDTISSTIEDLSGDLRRISLEIHDNPELQYKEYHAHKLLTEYLQKQDGWQVTPSAYGIETAFVATYDSGEGGPVVSFNAEYDALIGIGHACGHNLIAIVSLGAALATAKEVIANGTGGKVVLFGTPAEEGGGGKIKLLKAGAYRDNKVDVSLITHPGITPDGALVRTAAYSSFKVEYFGQITNGGLRPNIIHAYAAGRFVVRSRSKARLDALCKRVTACFEAGGTATGATLKLTPGMSYSDHSPNHALGRRYRHFFNTLGGDIPSEDLDLIASITQASTDQGNISRAMPSISPNIWIRSEGKDGEQLGGPHTPDFETAARSEESHELAKRAAKALAAVAVDVLTSPDLLDEIKREFEAMKQQ